MEVETEANDAEEWNSSFISELLIPTEQTHSLGMSFEGNGKDFADIFGSEKPGDWQLRSNYQSGSSLGSSPLFCQNSYHLTEDLQLPVTAETLQWGNLEELEGKRMSVP